MFLSLVRVHGSFQSFTSERFSWRHHLYLHLFLSVHNIFAEGHKSDLIYSDQKEPGLHPGSGFSQSSQSASSFAFPKQRRSCGLAIGSNSKYPVLNYFILCRNYRHNSYTIDWMCVCVCVCVCICYVNRRIYKILFVAEKNGFKKWTLYIKLSSFFSLYLKIYLKNVSHKFTKFYIKSTLSTPI